MSEQASSVQNFSAKIPLFLIEMLLANLFQLYFEHPLFWASVDFGVQRGWRTSEGEFLLDDE